MSATVCLSANAIYYPEGGGHLWEYLNWALGLRALGCEVIWLEWLESDRPEGELRELVDRLRNHLEPYGLADRLGLYSAKGEALPRRATEGCLDLDAAAEADLLLNIQYWMPDALVARFRRSALLDLDPGLLQLWMTSGQIPVARHDLYFTTGETVGTEAALFPDCGLEWHYTPPAVFLPAWPETRAGDPARYTTVAQWWGGWIEIDGEVRNNEKRTAFLEYVDLPSRAPAQLELALCLPNDDLAEQRSLERNGWHVAYSWDVCSTPERYRAYIQKSRGEFSCVKPSCLFLQNAWISNRTLCYLASGKPAIVQHTGPSRFLPDTEGLLRFRDLGEAAWALSVAEWGYERHCRLARALVEEYFDASKVVACMLERALA